MLGRSRYSRAMSTNIGAIDRRLRSLEQHLDSAGGRTFAGAVQTADSVGETIASSLSRIADRFREGDFGDEAAKVGTQAAKLGNDALRRLSKEIEHGPLVMLGVAVCMGILVGLVSHRRPSA
jgi:ElaB/YqjD/DUF883 family membrane-anchored ribosome-binding protein